MKARLPVALVDSILIVSIGAVLALIVTGGGVYELSGLRVSAHHARNLILTTVLVGALRAFLAGSVPLFGWTHLDLKSVSIRASRAVGWLHLRLAGLNRSSVRTTLLTLMVVSAAVTIANSWFYYGFATGDDVEVHEMALSVLFGWTDWEPWNLRNAFYPMTFIYPVQWLLYTIGERGEEALVFSGRLVVWLFSAGSIVLVYAVAREIFGSMAVGTCAAALLSTSHLHVTHASSVLPRTVAATFILLSLWVLCRFPTRKALASTAALALGIGASIRFSELILVMCIVLYLCLYHRYTEGVLVGVVSIAFAAFIVAVTDLCFWGEPLFSFFNLFRYTILEGQSSRGFQPAYYYLMSALSWGSPLLIFGVACALRRHPREGLILAVLPIALLSLLPHKEARYLVPVLPLVCIVSAKGIWDVIEGLQRGKTEHNASTAIPAAFLALLVVSLALEVDGYRFRRSESAVDMARFIRDQEDVRTVALQQVWRAGGSIYLWRVPQVLDIDHDRRAERDYVRSFFSGEANQYVALQAQDVEQFGYGDLAAEYGYVEVRYAESQGAQGYRLFKQLP